MNFEIKTKPGGGIRIQFGQDALTRLVRPSQASEDEYLDAPPQDLAFWLVHNWWRLRHEPVPSEDLAIDALPASWRLAHDFRSVEGGYRWPSAIVWGGDDLVFATAESDPVGITAPVQFLASARGISVPATEFESGVDRFLNTFAGQEVLGSEIAALRSERLNADYAAWRRVEAKLGFDPDAAPATVMTEMAKLASLYGSVNIEEAACAAPGDAAPSTLESLIGRAQTDDAWECHFSQGIHMQTVHSPSSAPWQAAEDVAAAVRSQLGGTDSLNDRVLANLCGTQPVAFAEVHTAKPQYGLRVTDQGVDRVVVRSRWRGGRRFQFARALGDSLLMGSHPGTTLLGPIADSTTSRQKFQRAFGAALLCPIDRLRSYLPEENPDADDIDAAAKHFEVSPVLVRSTLLNHGIALAA